MTNHPIIAVSVVSILSIAGALTLAAYRLGRTHAAWREAREARNGMRAARRAAWRHTAGFVAVLVALFATLFVAAFQATP